MIFFLLLLENGKSNESKKHIFKKKNENNNDKYSSHESLILCKISELFTLNYWRKLIGMRVLCFSLAIKISIQRPNILRINKVERFFFKSDNISQANQSIFFCNNAFGELVRAIQL